MRHTPGPGRVAWLALPFACAIALASTSLGSRVPAAAGTDAPAAVGSQSAITGWTLVGHDDESTLSAGEGVATVTHSHHPTEVLYRGFQSVPDTLKAQGWTHIGDPDSARGDVVDAYQGPSSGHSKMFLVTTPSGASDEYVHTLVRGELYNNSFAAISPDAQWMVAGEWETMSHLQIYPTPLLNHRSSRAGGTLRLAGYIQLDHEVNDVQGCDFVTPLRLICASDDDSRTLFPEQKPLLEIDLRKRLQGSSVHAHVVNLGPIPQQSRCSGTFEAEGVDFDAATGVLRLEVIQPGGCVLTTTIYEYVATRRHR